MWNFLFMFTSYLLREDTLIVVKIFFDFHTLLWVWGKTLLLCLVFNVLKIYSHILILDKILWFVSKYYFRLTPYIFSKHFLIGVNFLFYIHILLYWITYFNCCGILIFYSHLISWGDDVLNPLNGMEFFYFFLYPIFVSNILELVRSFCFIFKGPLEYPYIPNVGNFDIDGYLKGMNLRSWEILYWALDQSIPSSSTPSPICCYCCFCCKLRHQKMNLHNQWVNNGDIALP